VLVPLSWLVDTVPALAGVDPADLAARLTRAGLAVEGIATTGGDVTGPVVAGRVLGFEAERASNGKTIRWCSVDVGEPEPRGIVCGAANFAPGDVVPVALPGAVLPGPFPIAARRSYGHVSDGMICSARELGAGEEAGGILVLHAGTPVGTPIVELLGLAAETVLDVAVTPDRGYALSLRGIGREAATAYGVLFADPADVPLTAAEGAGPRVRVEDPAGCDRYVARTVTGLDPAAASPAPLRRRLLAAGMRPISLPVDVTNLVLLGLGQPLHAFDADRLRGPLVVRGAAAGERLRTLDGVERVLDPEDLVIADDSGPVALAGVMGGRATEVTDVTRRVVIESAHFDAVRVARTARRHSLASEASRRFERGVDPALPPYAAQVAADLLAAQGGADSAGAVTDVDLRRPVPTLRLPLTAAGRKAGTPFDRVTVLARLADVGCRVTGEEAGVLTVLPPPWRPDLTGEAELTEEVIRLCGYETIPVVVPRAPGGRGLSVAQRGRRAAGRALAARGYVEVVVPPFLGRAALDELGLPPGDARGYPTVVANPVVEDAGLLRTTLLPGLLQALVRNERRGSRDLALFEIGAVFLPGADGRPPAPRLGTGGAPSEADRKALDAALPDQPTHVAVVLAGARDLPGWSQPGRPVGWADAVAAGRAVAAALGVGLSAVAAEQAPWHPGRCAALSVGELPVGYAGELHPRLVDALGLPAGAAAAELDLDALLAAVPQVPVAAPRISPYPPVARDVALVVGADVPAAEVAEALRAGAGPWLESLRLFDLYTGEGIASDSRSLAYRLVLRATDRTLTDAEANAARDAAVAATAAATGARLRE